LQQSLSFLSCHSLIRPLLLLPLLLLDAGLLLFSPFTALVPVLFIFLLVSLVVPALSPLLLRSLHLVEQVLE
jgi:hypothetical protein